MIIEAITYNKFYDMGRKARIAVTIKEADERLTDYLFVFAMKIQGLSSLTYLGQPMDESLRKGGRHVAKFRDYRNVGNVLNRAVEFVRETRGE